MRSIRVLRNVLTNYLRFFLAGLLGLVLTPFLVRGLGDRDFGLWATVFSLTGYFGLFDQGIRPSLVRYVSKDHATGDNDGLSRTISSAFALYLALGLLTLAVGFLLAPQFVTWFHIEPSQRAIAITMIGLVALSIAIGFPFGVFGAVLSGLQRYDLANAIGMVQAVVRTATFVLVVALGGGLVALAWAALITNALGHAASWWMARRLLPGVRLAASGVRAADLRRIGSYSGFAFVGALATNLAFQTDALVITAYLGSALVTPFVICSGLVDNARTLVHSATYVLSPTASEMETLGETDKLHSMLIAGSKYSVLLAWPVLLGLIVFGPNLLTIWVGERFAPAALLLTILAVPTLVALPQATASSVLFGISRHKGTVALSLLAAVSNLGLSVWWAKWPAPMQRLFGEAVPPGLVGVAMGTAVPLLLVSGLATAWYSCRVLKLRLATYMWQGLLRPGLVALAFLPPALLAQRFLHPLSWVTLIGVCAASWLVFALIAWRFGVSEPERQRWSRMLPGLFGARRDAAETGR